MKMQNTRHLKNLQESQNKSGNEKLHEACGVAGFYTDKEYMDTCNPAAEVYKNLIALQHRGQESCGIAVCDGDKITLQKSSGLVNEVFNSRELSKLKGNISVGHVRYSTSGDNSINNAQPFYGSFESQEFVIAHNGQLCNHNEIKKELEQKGYKFSSTSDTEVILKLLEDEIKNNPGKKVTDVLPVVLNMIKGSFSLCIMTKDSLIGARDCNGIRPLCIGKKENNWIISSESCGIDAAGGKLVRDVLPGEIVEIQNGKLNSLFYSSERTKQTCIFEYVYFARPDSVIDGIPVQSARFKMGERLFKEANIMADAVIGVPDSGVSAALGFSSASGISFSLGLIKNKYIGRSFILSEQKERESIVNLKLNAIKTEIDGKRIVVIDDSLVRGTTCKYLIRLLRRAGAKEIHLRISSPQVVFPCYLGIDTPQKDELISTKYTIPEICEQVGADSLAFITLPGMVEVLKSFSDNAGFCTGCFNGEYPVPFI